MLRLAIELDIGNEARVAIDAVDDALKSGVGQPNLVGPCRARAVPRLPLAVVVHGGVVLHGVLELVLWRVERLWTAEKWAVRKIWDLQGLLDRNEIEGVGMLVFRVIGVGTFRKVRGPGTTSPDLGAIFSFQVKGQSNPRFLPMLTNYTMGVSVSVT